MFQSELTAQDLRFVLSRTPRDVRELLTKHPLFLAGGFIRSTIADEKPTDIDLLGPDAAKQHEIAKDLALDRSGRVHSTGNAYTVLSAARLPVQCIHRWVYTEPQHLLAEFDFTIAQAVIWWDIDESEWRSRVADTFYADLAGHRLVYTQPQRAEDVGGSMLRARKFIARGYRIDAINLARVLARLFGAVDYSRIDSEDDAAHVLNGLLREVDPLVVIDGFEAADEQAEV